MRREEIVEECSLKSLLRDLFRGDDQGTNPDASGAGARLAAPRLGVKRLFRWEKGEKIRASAKLWLLAVLTLFLVLGFWQMHTRTGLAKTKVLNRQLARSETFLIRGARIVVGDGKVIENGSVLVRGGKIAEIYEGAGPDPKTLKVETVEAAGKTILPGLIDVHVHLGAPGGFSEEMRYGDE